MQIAKCKVQNKRVQRCILHFALYALHFWVNGNLCENRSCWSWTTWWRTPSWTHRASAAACSWAQRIGVEESVRTANLEAGNARFLVDPAEHFALVKRLRGTGRDVVGAYHSHPRSAAVPSPTDVAEAFSEEFLCVIVSLLDPSTPAVRAYRLGKDAACELEVVEG